MAISMAPIGDHQCAEQKQSGGQAAAVHRRGGLTTIGCLHPDSRDHLPIRVLAGLAIEVAATGDDRH